MTKLTPEQCEVAYLDYFNNYLTVEKFAEHRGISLEEAKEIIRIGREQNHSIGVKNG